MDTLIITGWGWKEYAVAAAVALKGLGGRAEIMGMSRRRLPEYLEDEGRKWKRVFLIGMSLGGDEPRLAAALKAMKKTEVVWISSLPMSESQEKLITPLLKVHQAKGELFNGSLVRAVGEFFKVDVQSYIPFALEGNKIPRSVPPFHELICAAMYAYRNYRDEESFATAVRYLADGIREESWSPDAKRIVSHYRRYGNRELIGNSVQMKQLRERINFVAANPEARVLVIGESGTGKETVALQIHNRSARRNEAFYAFNCASVNPELLASRFFGHEKGAFTGADTRELGLFELASGGTLFLDEIGELPLAAQGLLLRVLEEGRFMRVGGTEEIAVDVRLITATNRNLPVRVREGKFREDLFMRLNVIQLRIPPLREHREDIRDVADNWWFNKFRRHLTDEQSAALMDYDYPGNVRELQNVLERAVVFKMENFSELMIEHRQMNDGLQEDAPEKSNVPDELDEVIRWHIKKVYQKYGQNVSKAAAALKITRNTLRKYL
ncbi:MAG: sigma-54 dependent transcriptional regulator [bacterium]|nr:sigma-54 dependent transcriptional regulator [bacterium]